jgi:hypothetical protein
MRVGLGEENDTTAKRLTEQRLTYTLCQHTFPVRYAKIPKNIDLLWFGTTVASVQVRMELEHEADQRPLGRQIGAVSDAFGAVRIFVDVGGRDRVLAARRK